MEQKEILQRLFDTSAKHVLTQGEPSIRTGVTPGCVYRSDDGKSCAAAPFIKNYIPEMDQSKGGSWPHLVNEWPITAFDEDAVKNVNFVRSLQQCHDDAAFPQGIRFESVSGIEFINDYREKMIALAANHHLDSSILFNTPRVS